MGAAKGVKIGAVLEVACGESGSDPAIVSGVAGWDGLMLFTLDLDNGRVRTSCLQSWFCSEE